MKKILMGLTALLGLAFAIPAHAEDAPAADAKPKKEKKAAKPKKSKEDAPKGEPAK